MAAQTKSKIEIVVEAKVKDALKELGLTEKEIDKLSKTSNKANNTFSGLQKTVKQVFGAIALKQVADFTLEVTKLSGKSDDLRRSLKNLADKEGLNTVQLMKDLRAATSNAVSDINLMKSATQGSFLGVDLKNMPVLFEFASKRARDTGQSIDYLVESIVTGIGRKSPLILDNLGIQMRDLDKEVEKIARSTGNWQGKVDETLRSLYLQQAAVTVAKRAIAESGEQTETTATQLERMNAQWENLKILIGEISAGPLAKVLKVLNSGLESLNEQISKQGQLDKLNAQLARVNSQIEKMENGELSFADKFAKAVGLYSSRLNNLKKNRDLTLKQIKEIQAELDAINNPSNPAGAGGAGSGDTPLAFNKDKSIPKVDAGFRNRNELTQFFDKLKSEFPDMAEMIATNQLALQSMFETVDENAPGFEEALKRGTAALEEQQRIALEVGAIIESSFQTLAAGLVDSATKGSEAWGDFFDTLKKQITSFLVSEAVKGLLGMFVGAIIPGGSALFGPSIFSKILGGSSSPSISAGLAAAPVASIGVPGIATPVLQPRGASGGLGGVINNIVNNSGGAGGQVEVVVRTVAPEMATVQAHYRKVNRNILIPDTDMVNQFNRTKKSEFD